MESRKILHTALLMLPVWWYVCPIVFASSKLFSSSSSFHNRCHHPLEKTMIETFDTLLLVAVAFFVPLVCAFHHAASLPHKAAELNYIEQRGLIKTSSRGGQSWEGAFCSALEREEFMQRLAERGGGERPPSPPIFSPSPSAPCSPRPSRPSSPARVPSLAPLSHHRASTPKWSEVINERREKRVPKKLHSSYSSYSCNDFSSDSPAPHSGSSLCHSRSVSHLSVSSSPLPSEADSERSSSDTPPCSPALSPLALSGGGGSVPLALRAQKQRRVSFSRFPHTKVMAHAPLLHPAPADLRNRRTLLPSL